MEESFRCHPFNRQPSICRFSVVIVTMYVSRETEVRDFQNVVVAHQHVSRGQIAMDALKPNVLTFCDLHRTE